jgi:hypothetical protein
VRTSIPAFVTVLNRKCFLVSSQNPYRPREVFSIPLPLLFLNPVFTQLLSRPAQFHPESGGSMYCIPSAILATSTQYNHPRTELASMVNSKEILKSVTNLII